MPPAPSTCSTRYFPASSSPSRIMGAPLIPRRAACGPPPRGQLENQLFADLGRIAADIVAVGAAIHTRAAALAVDAGVAPGGAARAVLGRDALSTERVGAAQTRTRIAFGPQLT